MTIRSKLPAPGISVALILSGPVGLMYFRSEDVPTEQAKVAGRSAVEDGTRIPDFYIDSVQRAITTASSVLTQVSDQADRKGSR